VVCSAQSFDWRLVGTSDRIFCKSLKEEIAPASREADFAVALSRWNEAIMQLAQTNSRTGLCVRDCRRSSASRINHYAQAMTIPLSRVFRRRLILWPNASVLRPSAGAVQSFTQLLLHSNDRGRVPNSRRGQDALECFTITRKRDGGVPNPR